jgi:hypothetical protein
MEFVFIVLGWCEEKINFFDGDLGRPGSILPVAGFIPALVIGARQIFFIIRLSRGRMMKKRVLWGSLPRVSSFAKATEDRAQPDPGLPSSALPGLGMEAGCFLQGILRL